MNQDIQELSSNILQVNFFSGMHSDSMILSKANKHLLSKSNIAVDNLADSSAILSFEFINVKKES